MHNEKNCIKMSYKPIGIHVDESIHDERLKRSNKVYLTAWFPRISANITPRCMLSTLMIIHMYFLNWRIHVTRSEVAER